MVPIEACMVLFLQNLSLFGFLLLPAQEGKKEEGKGNARANPDHY